MAFNFNWSPLIADTILARELLTTALNKTPKPPIIVDDIVVTELNLGSTPPEMTLLEVGDLAQDRFRGVFKVTYGGDAFLTLRTRVQANPLNTELQKRRRMGARGEVGWCEPGCLAADSGLTIPVAITLSDFQLSGFVILVFSRQKGLTLVFRNDPLESLKVSSTFDSIPFVRDYLQKTIEERLRALFMEDLPAILHRLSLRLWSEEHQRMDDRPPFVDAGTIDGKLEMGMINPLASPAQEPITCTPGDIEEMAQLMAQAMDSSTDADATFSQKNLQKLDTLSESQRTLSLMTPTPPDVMFRAWATLADRVHSQERLPLSLQHLGISSRGNSIAGSLYSSRTSNDDDSVSHHSLLSGRPSLARTGTSSSYIGLSERHRQSHHPQRRRKHRIINLRRATAETVVPDEPAAEASSTNATAANSPIEVRTPSLRGSSVPEDTMETPRPMRKASSQVDQNTPRASGSMRRSKDASEKQRAESSTHAAPPAYFNEEASSHIVDSKPTPSPRAKQPETLSEPKPVLGRSKSTRPRFTEPLPQNFPLLRSLSEEGFLLANQDNSSSDQLSIGGSSGGVLEQAWLQKMARETALRVRDEKRRRMRGLNESMDVPPAYAE